MCGIAGIIDLKGDRSVDTRRLRAMNAAQIHRGPDGDGEWYAPGVALGHRRLAIVDIAGGAQPFHAASGDLVLTFNGEIYNYKDLARGLASDGHVMRTACDTEALAEILARDGPDGVAKIDGMFAFAAWRPSAAELVLARDRVGERPLYYAVTDEGWLVFASEIDAVLSSGLIDDALDDEAIADFFAYGYVPDPKTIYRGVRRLPAASILRVRRGGEPRISTYWKPRFQPSSALSFDEAADTLIERLDAAVERQLMSDVPLGAFLSGGVDSSAIVTSMARASIEPVTTCTIGFTARSHDERDYARLVADQVGARREEDVMDFDVEGLIDDVAAAYGEPFADSSALPSLLLCRAARRHVTVALSGDGGDEVFAGYRRYPFTLLENRMRAAIPARVRKHVLAPVASAYPKLDWAPRFLRAKSTLQAVCETTAASYFRSVSVSPPEYVTTVLSPDFRDRLRGYDPGAIIAGHMQAADTDDPVSQLQYTDFKTWLPGRMLTKVDRASMRASLEVRPPILDHQFVDWCGTLPREFKLADGVGKRVFKQAMRQRIPHEILDRKKSGFDFPVAAWFRSEGSALPARVRAASTARESGRVDWSSVEGMLKRHISGEADHAQELWSLIMFDAFLARRRDWRTDYRQLEPAA
ncbi:MAG: asparagine synthase (glutamine-hydrolyzing) [Pseudomonadota bacterium]